MKLKIVPEEVVSHALAYLSADVSVRVFAAACGLCIGLFLTTDGGGDKIKNVDEPAKRECVAPVPMPPLYKINA